MCDMFDFCMILTQRYTEHFISHFVGRVTFPRTVHKKQKSPVSLGSGHPNLCQCKYLRFVNILINKRVLCSCEKVYKNVFLVVVYLLLKVNENRVSSSHHSVKHMMKFDLFTAQQTGPNPKTHPQSVLGRLMECKRCSPLFKEQIHISLKTCIYFNYQCLAPSYNAKKKKIETFVNLLS